MDTEKIELIFRKALSNFLEKDSYLLEHNVNERAITHRLSVYIEQEFNEERDFQELNLNVDCEYNRNRDQSKELYLIEEDEKREIKKLIEEGRSLEEISDRMRVYPDIIVHTRGSNENNILVVEAKKVGRSLNEVTRGIDYRKLELFTEELEWSEFKYKLGIFLELARNEEPKIVKYEKGKQVT